MFSVHETWKQRLTCGSINIYIYILIFIILYIDRQTYVKFELFILASNCRYPKIQVSYYASQIPPRDCVNLHTLTRGPACSRAATCLRARGASARRLSCCHVALNPCWFPTNSTSLLRHALMLPCGFKIVVAPPLCSGGLLLCHHDHVVPSHWWLPNFASLMKWAPSPWWLPCSTSLPSQILMSPCGS
jgi:hypothetical protein